MRRHSQAQHSIVPQFRLLVCLDRRAAHNELEKNKSTRQEKGIYKKQQRIESKHNSVRRERPFFKKNYYYYKVD